jgi:DNA primase
MIPDEVIAEIRSRADIVAVIGQHVQLRKAGRNWKGLCPFHGEKTPSFNVSPDKGFFYCFGCQKKGDVFTFVMELEGKSFTEVAEQLAARYGIEVPRIEESPELRRARGERAAMLDLNKLATAFFRDVLADPVRGEPGRAYLAKRGVGDEIATKFQLGYAPPDWHALADHLQDKRVDLELAVKLGLIARQPRAGGFYDRYRDRLVCPVIVPGGDVVGFSARILNSVPAADGHGEAPKYINSPESTVYKKSKLLFGLAQAREALSTRKRAVLVEGNFDVISLHQAGFTEVVAPLGTAITIEQILQLKRLTDRVVLLYDGDRAGYNATLHALQLCVEADVEVLVASRPGNARSGGAGPLSGGVDPDSLVAGGGAEQLRELVDRAQGGIEYFCFEVWGKARASADARARALDDAARLVGKVASPTKRDLILGTLATAMEVDLAVVQKAMQRGQGARPASAPGATAHAGNAGSAGNRGWSGTSGERRPTTVAPWAQGGRPDARPGPPRGDRHPNAPGGDDERATVDGGAPSGPGGDDAGSPAPTTAVAHPAAPPVSSAPPPTDEVELITLLTDHPSLVASPEADKAFWLLTDARLRDMYSAARAGQTFLELVPVQLPTITAQHVLSGKYAAVTDPGVRLAAMVQHLERKKSERGLVELKARMVEAGRKGDRELARKLAQLVEAERKGDRALADRLASEIPSNRKQVE